MLQQDGTNNIMIFCFLYVDFYSPETNIFSAIIYKCIRVFRPVTVLLAASVET